MKIRTKKMKKTAEEASSSAQTIASVDELLVQILLRLPMKSLLCFKCVSKHWLCLITNPQFALLRNPNPNPAVGLFLRFTNCYEYIPFDVHNPTTPPFKKLKSTKDPSGIYIVQSCNGLLLCAGPRTKLDYCKGFKQNYYVYNPTTKQLTKLPKPRRGPGAREVFRGVTLAFDPAKSPHYEVVCVRDSGKPPITYQFEIYSSETGAWRASSGPFMADRNTIFEMGLYWNGAVHWISTWRNVTSLCFNVYEERLGVMPMPPIPDDWHYLARNINYFDVSCDHLHLIEIYDPQIQFTVCEMKRDYSEWFVKYHVDLAEVATAFPEILRKPTVGINDYSFSIFSLIEKEEDAFLILRVPGKAIRYNLVSKTFEKLCDFDGAIEERYLIYGDDIAYQHIESLCCV